MATLRYAKKHAVCRQEIDEILALFEGGHSLRIEWRSMSRQQQRYGNRSRWAIYDGDEEIGQLYACSSCGEIFPVMPGNVYETLERCECCGAPITEIS